jgi:hypothetical protein
MSEQMESAKLTLEKLMLDMEEDELKQRINDVSGIISRNRKKIWLRTKTGKPLAEDIERSSVELVNSVRKQSGIEEALGELEAKAKNIEEESRRRSMVVT